MSVPPPGIESGFLAELRDQLMTSAVVLAGELPPRRLDRLVVTKSVVDAFDQCPAYGALVMAGRAGPADLDALAYGLLFEAIVENHLIRSVREYAKADTPAALFDQAVKLVTAAGRSTGDPAGRRCQSLDGHERLAWQNRLFADWRKVLAELPSVDERWWPRTEEPARVGLGDGPVELAGRLDVAFGGPGSGLPMVIAELKSGRLREHHRLDHHFYSLLISLRDGTCPAAVATVGVGPDHLEVWPESVTRDSLAQSADRVDRALARLAAWARSESPARTSCWHCAHCPERSSCPESGGSV